MGLRSLCSLLMLAWGCSDDGTSASTGTGAAASGGGGAAQGAAGPGGGGAGASAQGAGGAGASTSSSGAGGAGGAGGDDPLSLPPCPSGTSELALESSCAGAGMALPPGPQALLAASTRGQVLSIGDAVDAAECVPVRTCAPDAAPTLLFSDEPEYVSQDGVLYADEVPAGRYRLYIYHVNDGAAPRRFTAVALNQGLSPVSLTVEELSIAPPSAAFVTLGRTIATNYFSAPSKPAIAIDPSQRVVIDPDLDALVAEPGELGHAIVDLSTTGPLKISIVSVPESADAAAVTAGLSLLANSGLHVRGTFPLANRMLLTRHGSGLGRLRLGDDQSYDPDLIGTNYVDGGSVTLSGNFGVLYDVRVVDPTNDLALAINPRAGAWAGAMLGTAGQDQSGGALALPSGAGSLSSNDDVVSLGRYTSGISIGTKLLTAGGSSLPVHFVLAPL